MALTAEDIDTLDRAISSGERIVRFADRTVEYRSIDELIKARNAIESELITAQTPRRARVSRLYHAGKGF